MRKATKKRVVTRVTTGQVVPLRAVERPVEESVVHALEAALVMAKEGSLVSLFLVGEATEERHFRAVHVGDQGCGYRLIGMVHVALRKLRPWVGG